jgi:V/A-type H+-transporting ATPase subunit A
MLRLIRKFNDLAFEALDAGVPVDEIQNVESAPRLFDIPTEEDWEPLVEEIDEQMDGDFGELS